MKKNILRFISLICVMLILLALGACRNMDDTADTTDNVSNSTTETATIINAMKIIENGKAVFRIVYPDEPGAELFEQVKVLVDEVKKATGVMLETKSDFITWKDTHDSAAFEILLGATNYDESAAVLGELKAGDYAIRAIGNKIVITGHSTDMIRRAVSYFSKNLIPKNLVTGDDGKISLLFEEYTFMSTSAITSLKIDGSDLKNFSIIYSSSLSGCDVAAKLLRDFISDRCGDVLSVASDKNTPVSAYEFLVGPTNRTESVDFAVKNPTDLLGFTMGIENGKFVINAGAYTCKLAAQRFSAKYLFSGESSVNIPGGEVTSASFLKKTNVPLAQGADIRIMTANILAEFASWGAETTVYERAEIFASVLQVYRPDVVGVQEVTPQWDEMIPYYSGDKYEFLHMKTQDGLVNYSTIIYKKDKYNVIDSGVMYFSTEGKSNIRLVTWGVFEDKITSDRFIVFNSHWCWDTFEHANIQAREESALIKQVTEKYNYPYFCTADYNTKQDTENYNYFLSLTGAIDAKYAARDAGVLLNISGGCGALGTPRGETGNSIDHIFMTPSIKIFAFETVVINQTWDLSDHSPKYCDVTLK